jgi:spermidine synthase
MSTLYNTLKRVFAHVVIIPGDRNVFIASDAPLSTDMAPLIAARNIETTYVNKHFLHGRITEERLPFITGHLDADVPVNQDFRPTAFYYSLRLWLSMFREQYRIPLGIAGLFFVIYIASLGTVSRTVFSTGFMASSMEVIILLCYQIVHGSMYKGIGVIIAAFMLGLAAGSYVTNQLVSLSRRTLVNIELLIIVYLLTYTAMLSGGTPVLPPAAFWLMALAVGALTGAEFPVASRLDYVSPSKTAGSLYAADLLGGSLGAFTVSLFLIPVVGIYGTCLLIIGAKILIVAGLRAGTKRRE